MFDFVSHLSLGFATALSPWNVFYCFIGTLIGTLIGVLPGIGPVATIAMLLPLTFHLDATSALIMLAGIYYGAQYGGSTTAILVNLPGEISASVTAIEGYQMARQGRAGTALAIAAIGSFIAGTLTTFMIAVFAIPLTRIAAQFGPAEYFSLIILGFILSTTLARGSILTALAMITTGVALGTIGTDNSTGAYRFTLGMFDLADGLSIVALALGVFGVSEIFRNLETLRDEMPTAAKINSLMPSMKDLRESIGPILRATGVGGLLGVLPGGGSLLGTFASYAIEKKLSRHPEEFGHGALAGVAGPEAANNAGAQASFIPLLTLGIPATSTMALMMGAMMIQGIVPGPRVSIEQPALFWGVICSMWVGNAMLVILNLPLVGIWVWLLRVPYTILFPSIIAFSTIGVFTVNNSVFDLYILAGAALFGYVMAKLDCEPAPFLLGFVLGPMLETYMRRAMAYSNGDPTTFITQPISAGLLAAAALTLVIVSLPRVRGKREQIFVEDD